MRALSGIARLACCGVLVSACGAGVAQTVSEQKGNPARSEAAKVAANNTFATDARLEQKVALQAEGIPVSDLLARLSASCGVSLRANGDVGDDKVIAFSPSRSLRDTLNDLATLFNDEWQPAPLPDGKTRYLLIRRLSARHYEDGLEQAVGNRIRAQLEEQVRALDETPEQFAKRLAGDRIRKNLENPSAHGRQATRLYAQLSRDQRDTLFARGFVNVSFKSSTPAQQTQAREAFTEVVTTLKALDEKQRAEHPEVHIVIDPPESLDQHGARFRLTRTNNAGLSALVVQVILGQNTFMTLGEFESADTWLLPPHGNPYTHPEALAGKKATIKASEEAELVKLNLPASALARPVDSKDAWIDRVKSLAESAKIPIFADYYRSPALIHELSKAENAGIDTVALLTAPLAANNALLMTDSFCKPSGYLWWAQGKTLLLRKRDWYAQRRYEAPERWLRTMQARLRQQQGVPTYDDLCRLLDLTPQQISGMNAMLENNGDVGMVDLDRQEGLHELLTLIQASSEPSASLPLGEPTDRDVLPRHPPNGQPTPQQTALTSAFLDTMRQHPTPANLRSFVAQISCYTPAMLKAAQSPSTQNVQVNLSWKLEGSAAPIAYRDSHWMLWLPLQIPNDRSANTRIEVTPPEKKE